MYAIYGNIYHQYTPVMLAFFYQHQPDPMGHDIISRSFSGRQGVLIQTRPGVWMSSIGLSFWILGRCCGGIPKKLGPLPWGKKLPHGTPLHHPWDDHDLGPGEVSGNCGEFGHGNPDFHQKQRCL